MVGHGLFHYLVDRACLVLKHTSDEGKDFSLVSKWHTLTIIAMSKLLGFLQIHSNNFVLAVVRYLVSFGILCPLNCPPIMQLVSQIGTASSASQAAVHLAELSVCCVGISHFEGMLVL